ncbi:hypothetical protein PHYSODRAFT_447642, partial [Phytophthora sojae]
MDVDEEREYRRRHDMTDFSAKNKLPEPPKAKDIADILAALEVLSLLSMTGPEAVPELVAWIDDCFEQFRSYLVRQDLVAAADVKMGFQFNSESYARVVHRVTNLRVEAATRAPPRRTDTRHRGAQRKTKGAHQPSIIPVPQAVVAALPIRKGKKLCVRFLSVDGCPGDGDTCVYDYRGHFVPTRLPTIIKTFIAKAYGGMRATSS